jgi:hypothetical protein
MLDGKAIVVLIAAGALLAIYLYARKRAREQEESDAVQIEVERRPRRTTPEDILDSVDWWSRSRLWPGVERRSKPPIYDQEADAPLERPAYVGSGRGHEL